VFEAADGGLELSLEYDTDLYAEPTARQMLGNFHTILEAIAADSEARLTSITLLTNAENAECSSNGTITKLKFRPFVSTN
jgi:hypothetical protein